MSSTPTGSSGEDLRTEPKRADQSLGELFSELTRDLGQLVRDEVQLAKVEARDEVKTAATGAGMMAGAAIAALLFLTMTSTALALWLDEAMHPAVAFLIVALLWAVIAAVLVTVARNRLKRVRPLPQTTETLKEDVQWAQTLKR